MVTLAQAIENASKANEVGTVDDMNECLVVIMNKRERLLLSLVNTQIPNWNYRTNLNNNTKLNAHCSLGFSNSL